MVYFEIGSTKDFENPNHLIEAPLIIKYIPFDRARRVLFGTQHFIVDTHDWTNNFEKNSNQLLTSRTFV
jgi:hypothetical protein